MEILGVGADDRRQAVTIALKAIDLQLPSSKCDGAPEIGGQTGTIEGAKTTGSGDG